MRPDLTENLADPARLSACMKDLFAVQAPSAYSAPRAFSGPVIQSSKVETIYVVGYGHSLPQAILRFVTADVWRPFMYPGPFGENRFGAHASEMDSTALLEEEDGKLIAKLDLTLCRKLLGH